MREVRFKKGEFDGVERVFNIVYAALKREGYLSPSYRIHIAGPFCDNDGEFLEIYEERDGAELDSTFAYAEDIRKRSILYFVQDFVLCERRYAIEEACKKLGEQIDNYNRDANRLGDNNIINCTITAELIHGAKKIPDTTVNVENL